ncbi:MAG TPA: STAS domain-containing protein, partial [bacterium]|nr:STAS domain-containing protein [bacterium]
SAKVSPAPKRPNLFLNTRSDISNGSVMVMDIEGVLDLNTVGLFEDALLGLFSRQQYRIVLNMKKVAYISSAGFGVLISVIKEVRQKNGDIKIANVHRDVLNVFEMLGLPDLFRIFRMEKEAVEAFRS